MTMMTITTGEENIENQGNILQPLKPLQHVDKLKLKLTNTTF